jgi:hypothetical protein
MYQHQAKSLDHRPVSFIPLPWAIVNHTFFMVFGMGMALLTSNMMGYRENASLFLIASLPVIYKMIIGVGCLALLLILIDLFKS